MVNDSYRYQQWKYFKNTKRKRLEIATKNAEPLFNVMYELEKN